MPAPSRGEPEPAERAGRRKALLDLEAEVARAAKEGNSSNSSGGNSNLHFVTTVNTLVDQLMTDLMRVANTSQALLHSSHRAIVQCEENMLSAVRVAVRDEAALAAKSGEHSACLAQESVMEESVRTCQQLVALRLQSKNEYCAAVKTAAASSPVPSICQADSSEDLEQQLARMKQGVDSALKSYRGKKENCSQALAALNNATADCNAKIQAEVWKEGNCTALARQMDGLSCGAGTHRKIACSTAESCRQASEARYKQDKASVASEETSLKDDVTIAMHVRCLTGLLSRGAGSDSGAIQSCMTTTVDTSSWDISYPAVPSASTCTLADKYPCNAAYLDAHYGSSAEHALVFGLNGAGAEYLLNVPISTKQTGVYTLKALAKASADWNGFEWIFHSRWWAGSTILGVTEGGFPSKRGVWQEVSVTFNADSAPTKMAWYVGYPLRNGKGSLAVTDLQILDPSGQPLLSDGTFPGGKEMQTKFASHLTQRCQYTIEAIDCPVVE